MSHLAAFWHKLRPHTPSWAIALFVLVLAIWTFSARQTEPIDSFARCADDGNPVSDTNPPVCRDGSHSFVGPRLAATPTAQPGIVQNFEILVTGDSRGSYPKRQEVITDQTGWQRYWRAVHAGISPVPPLLQVNFDTSNVIALSEGLQVTGGYNLKVSSVIMSPAGTIVNVTETIPTITCNVAHAPSNRYFIARTTKLTEPVSFRISTDHHRCK